MKTIENVITEDLKKQIEPLVLQYFESNEALKFAKDSNEFLKSLLKTLFADNGISKFETDDGIKISVTNSSKISFDEDLLLEFAKTKEIPELVKTREYVDMEILEDSLYHKDIEPSELIPMKKETIITKLTCTKSKKKLLKE